VAAAGFTFQDGALVLAQFSDGAWYRAQVNSITPSGGANILYIDFGTVRPCRRPVGLVSLVMT
jgi:hypothetical protein